MSHPEFLETCPEDLGEALHFHLSGLLFGPYKANLTLIGIRDDTLLPLE